MSLFALLVALLALVVAAPAAFAASAQGIVVTKKVGDVVAPAALFDSSIPGAAGAAYLNGALDFNFTSTLGFASFTYRIDNGAWASLTPTGGMAIVSVPADGTKEHKLDWHVTDTRGGSSVGSQAWNADSTPPVITVKGVSYDATGSGTFVPLSAASTTWAKPGARVKVDYTLADPIGTKLDGKPFDSSRLAVDAAEFKMGDGPAVVVRSGDPYTIPVGARGPLTLSVKDNALITPNVATVQISTVQGDITPPTVELFEMGSSTPVYSNGFCRIKASDTESGIAKVTYAQGAAPIDVAASPVGTLGFVYNIPLLGGDGTAQQLSFGATDAVGNVLSRGKPIVVFIDKSAPVTTVMDDIVDGTTSSEPLALSFAAKDSCSGVAFTEYSINGSDWTRLAAGDKVTLTDSGTYEIQYRSTDKALPAPNAETTKSLTVKIIELDTVGPVTFARNNVTRRNATTKLRYCATDNMSKTVSNVVIVVKNARNKTVKTIRVSGDKQAGVWYTASFRSAVSGVFRYYVYAEDDSGNSQSKIGSARITVR